MGEVYSGYDSRLERPIALKRIRPGTEEPEKAMRRFRQEAQAVARLHHPSIVQVHDWVDTDDGSWIVMELVQGQSLRHVLRDQGLPTPLRTAQLAHDILQGLVAAHAEGILHRDLKAENVMLTDTNPSSERPRAKILDVGVATPIQADDGLEAVFGETLGTVSAVSPEQITDRRADPRSDLFSLGNLLYEMTTGRFPFLGPTVRETMLRICTLRPPSAHSLDPSIPESLSTFIDLLLAKDPRQRPASARHALVMLEAILDGWPEGGANATNPAAVEAHQSSEVMTPTFHASDLLTDLTPVADTWTPVATPAMAPHRPGTWRLGVGVMGLVSLLLWAALGWRSEDPPPIVPKPRYVAVPATVMVNAPEGEATGSSSDTLALAASAISTAVMQGLSNFHGLAAMEPSSASKGITDTVALARSMAADEVFVSRLECREESCRLILRRLDGTDGRILWTHAFRVELDHYLDLSRATLEHLRAAYSSYELRPEVAEFGVRADDYEAYLRLRHRSESRDQGGSIEQSIAELVALESTSPRFLEAPLFRAGLLIRRYQETKDDDALDQARSALERASVIAPRDPGVLARRAQLARIAGDLGVAEEILQVLQRLEPGNTQRLHEQALFFQRTGNPEKALQLMRQVVERLPAASYYFNLADLAYRQGDVDGARQALEQGLQRAPEYYNGLSRLAQLELFSGSPQRAVELYEQLIARAPEATELTNLGTAYLLLADYEQASSRFHQALDLAPTSPFALLNLADAELLAGQESAAMEHYRQVVERVEEGRNRDGLRGVQAQALAHLQRTEEATRAIEDAIALKPDHPWVAFEAAVVYALLGEPAKAKPYIAQALAGGVDPRWFTFPWFDSLQGDIRTMVENRKAAEDPQKPAG